MRTTHAQDPDYALIADSDVVVYTFENISASSCVARNVADIGSDCFVSSTFSILVLSEFQKKIYGRYLSILKARTGD